MEGEPILLTIDINSLYNDISMGFGIESGAKTF